MKQMKASHRKIAPKKERSKKRSLQISISLLEWTRSFNPPQHGQCLGIGKTRIIVKVVGFFLFRNLSSERQVKARNPDATEAGGFITCLVRFLPPPRVWFGAREGRCKPPGLWLAGERMGTGPVSLTAKAQRSQRKQTREKIAASDR